MTFLHKNLFCICILICISTVPVHALSLSKSPSSSSLSSSSATITDFTPTNANASITNELIPGLVSDDCGGLNERKPPCVAVCRKHDSACMSAASSVSSTCAPQWNSYISKLGASTLPSKGSWSWVTKVHTSGAGVYTSTWSEYTTFSTALGYSVIGYGGTTITPVYALGTPVTHTSVYTSLGWSESWITAPPPTCRYHGVSWLTSDTYLPPSTSTAFSTSCGQCTIYGGTVELLWWPALFTSSIEVNDSIATKLGPSRSTVINGTTLVSPTVYISLHAVSASDYCSPVGKTFSSTLLAMNPTDVSTQVHFGGKAAATGANWYGPLNYSHLTGLPPVSEYEHQPSCIFAGCATIYPIPVKPTLVVPTQIRSLDPAWADCAGALAGLYDPPIALDSLPTESGSPSIYPPALPHNTARPSHAKETWTAVAPTSTFLEMQRQSLAGILGSIAHENQSHRGTVQTAIEPTSDTASKSPQLTPGSNGKPTQSISKAKKGPKVQVFHGIGTTSLFGAIEISSSSNAREVDGSQQSLTDNSQLQISTNSINKYIVNGQTFAPSSPITLTGIDGPVTYRMQTSNSQTYVAIGSSTTVLLVGAKDRATSTDDDADLEFTRASNGNFVLHGTTLVSGEPITIGLGSSKTTLRVTTLDSTPAIVLDGSITELLGHDTSSVNSMSKFSAPAETEASGPVLRKTPAYGAGPVSSEARSSAPRHEPLRLSLATVSVVLVLLFSCS